MKKDKKFSVHIVNYELGRFNGILSKYANKMKEELEKLGVKVSISNKPEKADINHHINYISYLPSGNIDTTMITHITGDKNQSEEDKIKKIKEQKATGICFSKAMKDKLTEKGVKNLEVVISAHDSLPRRPRSIFLAYNINPDGRKREGMFLEMLKNIDITNFVFIIMGTGWGEVLKRLPSGTRYSYLDHFDAHDYKVMLDSADYLLYTGGEDALPQSIIDAKQAGLRIIAPPQDDIYVEYQFITQKDLNRIFSQIEENPVKDWTFERYAMEHLKIWEKIYQKKNTKK